MDATNPVPPISSSAITPLTYTYYDDYGWSGHQAFQSSYLSKTTAASNPYAQSPATYSKRTRGRVTGTKVKVLNSDPEKWLTTTTYYDDKGRVLQTLSGNITGGTDVMTGKYDFSGKLLSTYVVNHNSRSTVTPETSVLTENLYDAAGRLTSITKTVNDQAGTKRTIATNTYNELGQLKTKVLGNHLETLTYDYNISGWLQGINKSYANGSGSHYFGMAVNYDHGYNQHQYDGNIAGEQWRTKGDGQRRSYGFSYDNVNRLTKADFTQYTGGWNTSAGVDFSVYGLTYDANGNIGRIEQNGLKVNVSSTIDNLSYTYQPNSNQLSQVNDAANDPGSMLGDFHYSGSKDPSDYAYDGDGNLTTDANKKISLITYNHLNLPENITVTGKGTIKFVYGAAGNKLQKIVTDNTAHPQKTTTTDYIGGFEYLNDTLQFFPTEDGRVRTIIKSGQPVAYTYDYFIKDPLGNVRVVLTEQTGEETYGATMESQNATVENQLFDNISSTTVAKPPGFDGDTNNKNVSQLDGSSGDGSQPRVGPAIVLKVMAGDTLTIAANAWYQGAVQPPPSNAENLLNDLLSALTGGVISNSQGLYSGTNNNPQTILSGDLPQFFTNDEDENYSSAKPKAFLNWVAFDNQMKMVDANSGVVQVPAITGSMQAQPLVAPEQIIQKNGYIYVYLSNESAQKVFFDNLVIHHSRGPLLQENSYYPYGLTMAGISDRAALMPENKQLFNDGSELNHGEFADGSGIGMYDFHARAYDPAIGRFNRIDPMASDMVSPYAYVADNPVLYNDPSGMIRMSLSQFLVDARGSENGGMWNAGGGGGDATFYGSQTEAFVAGADYMNAWGLWGAGNGKFAASDAQATTAFNKASGLHLLQGVTIKQNDPGSLAAARSTVYQEVQEDLDGITDMNAGANIIGAASLTFDATRYSVIGAQMLGNAVTGTTYAIQDFGKLQFAKFGRFGITTEIAGRSLGAAGILMTGYDMIENGVNWTNGTDLVMEGIAFIPVVGWAISGTYFLSDIIVEHYTGKSIGQHLGDWYNTPIVQEGIHGRSIMPPTF